MKRVPYIQDPLTGLSATRRYVEAFLESAASPVTEDGETTRSVYDSIYSTVPVPPETLYLIKPKNPTKTYIGRASLSTSHKNPNEYLWCLLADFSAACKQLDDRSRKALGLRYCADWDEYATAEALGCSASTISRIVSRSLDKITAILDGIENE